MPSVGHSILCSGPGQPIRRIRRDERPLSRVLYLRRSAIQTEDEEISRRIILTEKRSREKWLYTADGGLSIEQARTPEIQKQTKKMSDSFISTVLYSRKSDWSDEDLVCEGLFLPTGFPDSVSSDYLAYQLWTLPTHITGWVSASLATSSLLRAVGVGSTAVQATTAAVAIKWITKDGVGAVGKLVVGGRLGVYIDEDPRLWRMLAEGISTLGLSLEIGTVFFPSHFLLLAGSGNFAKALAKGMAKPSFRVIQQHFSRLNNIGEVSAKEESWEVAGQTIGVLTSVGILTLLEGFPDWKPVLFTWMMFHTVHIICRYFALNTLVFDSPNVSRLYTLLTSYMQLNQVPDPATVSRNEAFLLDWMTVGSKIQFGSSLTHIIDNIPEGEFEPWVELFLEEKYLLYIHDGHSYVVLKEGYQSSDCVRAYWHEVWVSMKTEGEDPTLKHLEEGISEMNLHFADFEIKAKAAGWNLDNLYFRVGKTRVADEI